MEILKYVLVFLGSFIFIYLFYFFVIVNPHVRSIRNKKDEKDNKKKKKEKKEKKYPPEMNLFLMYYKIDSEKVGIIRMFRVLNFVNALMLSVLVTIVYPINQGWLRILILAILIMPTIWFTYYYLAKYFKKLEGKFEKNV